MATLRSNTDKQLAALKSEMEATMLDMVNQIGDINSGMKALELGMHADFGGANGGNNGAWL